MKKIVAICLCIISLFVSIPVFAAESRDVSEERIIAIVEVNPTEKIVQI